MHAIIGAQRDNWNTLLLGSVNSITLAAALMAGLSAVAAGDGSHSGLAFKLSSALLYAAATGMLVVVNRIQPSQLVEEQRNAARLFRQLDQSIRTSLSLRKPTGADVDRAMDRVLALDRAYPLPLLGGMLDKFPKAVQPTVWWPKLQHPHPTRGRTTKQMAGNGWSEELEKEMEGVMKALKRKDVAEYVKLGKLVLKINRALALSGPLLTGLAAVATTAIDPSRGSWPVVAGVACGVLATVVNTVEHGGQVGMVFELFRNIAGYYEQLEEMIESSLEDGEGREDGELFEMKVALQLGRTTSELKDLAASSSSSSPSSDDPGFAGKLF